LSNVFFGSTEQTHLIRNIENPSIDLSLSAERKDGWSNVARCASIYFYFQGVTNPPYSVHYIQDKGGMRRF